MRFARALRFGLGSVLALVVIVALAVGLVRSRRETARLVDELRGSANTGRRAVFTPDELEGLPTPVRAYFEATLEEGQPYVDSVRLKQAGRLRIGDASSPWKPFTATQYITVEPPGFFWNASIDFAPFVSIHVRDLYRDGSGAAAVSLFGVVPLDSAESTPELDEAELIRYLAEAVWYPTALLPGDGVQWESVDEQTAEATVEYGDASASLTFSFNEANEVTRVHTEGRNRRVGSGFESTPWSGHWRNYQRRNGVRIPTEGEVVWHLPDGDFVAWQGQLTAISYDDW